MEVDDLVFFVNGKKVTESNADPETTLLQYLRSKLRLPGTKLGCGEGGCGTCTVMISKYDQEQDKILHLAANACLVPICSLHGLAVTTVEGIGSTKTRLHPVQEIIAKSHGTQCGFCTPGMVMSMYTLLRNKPKPTEEEVEHVFQGNLCRCTGYRPILDGFKTFSRDVSCLMGDQCCKNQPTAIEPALDCAESRDYVPFDSTQEPIFPPELKLANSLESKLLTFVGERITWFRPVCLEELLELKYKYHDARLVIGSTSLALDLKDGKSDIRVMIAATHVPELQQIVKDDAGIHVGGAVSLARFGDFLAEIASNIPERQARIFKTMQDIVYGIAGQQIRNVASLAGNILWAHHHSDLVPLLMATGSTITLISKERGRRDALMDNTFFVSRKKWNIGSDEIILSVFIPYSKENEFVSSYKQTQRRENAGAIVNAGMRVLFEDGTKVIKELSLAFGGMSETPSLALKTAKNVIGRKWDEQLLTDVSQWLAEDFPAPPDGIGGHVAYKRTLAECFFFKFYLKIHLKQCRNGKGEVSNTIPQSYASAALTLTRGTSRGTQVFEEVPPEQPEYDAVGRPLPHKASMQHATGEAQYCDDMPFLNGELYLALVTSTRAHAKILSIDTSEALALPGVEVFFGHKDVPGSKIRTEEIFASEEVTSYGQVIGAIVADTKTNAQRAAKTVKIEYQDLPTVLTMEEAIEVKSYYPVHENVIKTGDTAHGFEQAEHILEGEIKGGGQEHFYLETNGARAVPRGEDGEIEIFCGIQGPSDAQAEVARALGIPMNRVLVRTKRMGGAFGGKQLYDVLLPVALAAQMLNRPVRCMLDRDEDMLITGGRHPFLAKYKVGVDSRGRLLALEATLYLNAGNVCDLSPYVLGEALDRFDSCYLIPNLLLTGVLCKTNLRSNTAFRGFGSPQSVLVGVDSRGRLLALEATLYLNAGNVCDLSPYVLGEALDRFDSCYLIPNLLLTGVLCKTNLRSNTAFRGFGSPQSVLVMENIIEDIAVQLKIPPRMVREVNMYKENDLTPNGNRLVNCNIGRCWTEVIKQSGFHTSKKEVEAFNSKNRWKKRGIALVPAKYPITNYPNRHLQNGAALVHVYQEDGSVLITHGGVEMGQGLHTKLIQIASRALQIPVRKIHINETSTDTVPNATATNSSTSTDYFGMAVLNACKTLKERLAPYVNEKPSGTWEDWVKAAYMDRISLSATGFYKVPDTWDDSYIKGEIAKEAYHTYGAACSVVEIDCLTGDHVVLRTDIVMDVGRSLNPAIDIGQIEGAFAQGYGLYTIEKLRYTSDGKMVTTGPNTYKIPGYADIPVEFNVSFLKGASNPRAVYSSKGIGEPPLLLASAVFFAIKDAISSARAESGLKGRFRLDSPATAERIRMACEDHFTKHAQTHFQSKSRFIDE
ncbi:xanthine dehydrogenase/oxidase [Lingula anatina]|uniref:xanthine dehydrogenase n=1 Tax=Lingula anatina TaxID=7574 RepID=A0A1S3HPS3_LINAN|nr:xanthine dehydrogenase/oxidase [Lingula anatina]|eukprot:XP_013387039.1 xanthine dehydrogenase/oxidase [Lingula anatina]